MKMSKATVGSHFFCPREGRYIVILERKPGGYKVLNLKSGRKTSVMHRTLESQYEVAKPAGLFAFKRKLLKER